MVKSYLLIALRNIFRSKLFSLVNILGLMFGMGSALLIFLWVNDELGVNMFHSKIKQLYQVKEHQTYSGGKTFTFDATPGPMAPFIKQKFPEIEMASRWTWPVTPLLQYREKSFKSNGRFVDTDFILMFDFPFLQGDKNTALNDRNSIVLTESFATKMFGDEDPMGKLIVMDTRDSYQVTGVLKDIPKNSSIVFDYLLPFETWFEQNKNWVDTWGSNNIRTFIQLKEGTDAAAFQAKIVDEVKEHNEGTNVKLFIQPFSDVYLYGKFTEGKQDGGRIDYVRIFFIVAVFVLVIACINFMNLSTAQASKRAKEVGLRKVIGAVPRQLFRQFMGESSIMVIMAALMSLLVVVLLLPKFNELTGKSLSLSLLDTKTIAIFAGLIFFTSVLAGAYPAIFISEFKPVQVLKGQLKSGRRAAIFRKSLVVVQFTLSIFLIVSTIVVYRQMDFMQNRNIGFDRDNVFYSLMEGEMAAKYETIRNRLLQSPGVESVSLSSQLPIDIGNSTGGLNWEGRDPDVNILFSTLDVDFDFVQMMKMTMAEGRPFNREIISDTVSYIVNETGAEKIGFQDGTADKDLTLWGRKGKIVGVVKDFNFGSLHSAIEPMVMRVARSIDGGCLLVRAKKGETGDALASLDKIWKEYAPAYPVHYSFLNQHWDEFYKAEGQRGKIFNALSGLSIFISCLGLFGLSAFSAERRIKELGIRKVMGASVTGLLQLMAREFTILVMVAAIVGCPVSYYFMDLWLHNYAYHVDVGWYTLVIATALCLFVSLATILYHSLKATMANPVKSLRYE
ncbi:MAG TPA: ABC transporter permease [Cyclobacteriaceae bacterium]|nr:ABC transporter permease [Cyclobacteriaceae bacterium]